MIASLVAILMLHRPATAAPTVKVWSRGYFENLRTVYPKGQVKMMDHRTVAAEERRQGYLPADQRDKVFKSLKLDRALAKYDEVDKDLLVMFVRDSNTSELVRIHRKYPNVSLTDLRRLRLALGKLK